METTNRYVTNIKLGLYNPADATEKQIRFIRSLYHQICSYCTVHPHFIAMIPESILNTDWDSDEALDGLTVSKASAVIQEYKDLLAAMYSNNLTMKTCAEMRHEKWYE